MNVVRAQIGLRVRVDRALEQAQPQRALVARCSRACSRSSSATPYVRIGEVDPALGRHLEGGLLPAGVAMRRPIDRSELDLVRRPAVRGPVVGKPTLSSDCRSCQSTSVTKSMRGERAYTVRRWHDARARTEPPAQFEHAALRTRLAHLDRFEVVHLARFGRVVGVDVPGVVVERLVLEDHQPIAEPARRHHLALDAACPTSA